MDLKQEYQSSAEGYELGRGHPAFLGSIGESFNLKHIPVNLIKGIFQPFKNLEVWFEKEICTWRTEHGDETPNKWQLLETYFLENPNDLPVLLIEGNDGFYYLEDGHHRLAIAMKHEHEFILAIIRSK